MTPCLSAQTDTRHKLEYRAREAEAQRYSAQHEVRPSSVVPIRSFSKTHRLHNVQPATPAAVVEEVLRLREALDRAEGEASRARASALESSATAAAVIQHAEVRTSFLTSSIVNGHATLLIFVLYADCARRGSSF